MVKCGPKPRKLTARQFRNLEREEKRTLALQRSARQAVHAPPSPRKKKASTRQCQYEVSLAKKKRVKSNSTFQASPQKAGTESSIAFSAATDEIPLFEALKRENRLVYVHVPQQPVPLAWPTMPVKETSPVTSIGCPAVRTTAYSNRPTTPAEEALLLNNAYPPVIFTAPCEDSQAPLGMNLDEEVSPRPDVKKSLGPLSAPLRTPDAEVQLPSRFSLWSELADTCSPLLDDDSFQTLGPPVTPSASLRVGGRTVPLGVGSTSSPMLQQTFFMGGECQQTLEADAQLPVLIAASDARSAVQLSGPAGICKRENDSLRFQAQLGQTGTRIVLPLIRPLVIQPHTRNLHPLHVLSKLSIPQNTDATTHPRVQLPKQQLCVNTLPVTADKDTQADSPEKSYHRSLMTSIWAEPPKLESSPIKQGQMRHDNPNIVPSLDDNSEARADMPAISPYRVRQSYSPAPAKRNPASRAESNPIPLYCQVGNQYSPAKQEGLPGSAHVVKSAHGIHAEDVSQGSFSSNRRILGSHRGRIDMGTNRTVGAFANAILRQTGHLKCGQHGNNAGIRDEFTSLRAPEQSKSFRVNNTRFHLPPNDTIQTRAPTILSRGSADASKLSLAPAAIIRNDPFRQPVVRPSRKRLLPNGRVVTYKTEYGRVLHKSNSANGVVDKEQGSPVDEAANVSGSSKRNWAKRVIDVPIDRVEPSQDESRSSAQPSQANSTQVRSQLCAAMTPLGVTRSESQHIIGKKRSVLTALKTVYNKLWA